MRLIYEANKMCFVKWKHFVYRLLGILRPMLVCYPFYRNRSIICYTYCWKKKEKKKEEEEKGPCNTIILHWASNIIDG